MILISNLSSAKIPEKKILVLVEKILKILKKSNWRLEVFFLTPKKMSKLHQKYLKKSGPTTIISVETDNDFPEGRFSGGGEIYLCLSQIKKSPYPLDYFLIHGILHLSGFDHQTNLQAKKMLAKEKELCARIKL